MGRNVRSFIGDGLVAILGGVNFREWDVELAGVKRIAAKSITNTPPVTLRLLRAREATLRVAEQRAMFMGVMNHEEARELSHAEKRLNESLLRRSLLGSAYRRKKATAPNGR